LSREPDSVRRHVEGGKNLISKASIIGRLKNQAYDVLIALFKPCGHLPGAPVIKKKEKTHVG
jgi:hypothetical protein